MWLSSVFNMLKKLTLGRISPRYLWLSKPLWRSLHSFFIGTSNIFPSFNVLIFCQFEPQMFLFLLLLIYVLTNCNMYTWQLLQTWPVEKAENFPFQMGKKEILKNLPKYKIIAYKKLLIDPKLFCFFVIYVFISW